MSRLWLPCTGQTTVFFSERAADIEQAKRVCAGCELQAQCLELGAHEEFGVFGGMTAAERRAQRKRTAA